MYNVDILWKKKSIISSESAKKGNVEMKEKKLIDTGRFATVEGRIYTRPWRVTLLDNILAICQVFSEYL